MAFVPRSDRERDMGLTSSGGVIHVLWESGGRTAASMISISLVDVNKNELLVQLQACMKYVFQKEYLVSRNSKYGSCVSHFHLQS